MWESKPNIYPTLVNLTLPQPILEGTETNKHKQYEKSPPLPWI